MGSTGSGSKNQQTATQQTTTQNPWGPTIAPITDLIGQIRGQMGNTGVTGNEQVALDRLMKNAQAGNPYTGQIDSLANDLLGGGTDRTGIAQGAYDAYKAQAQPYLSADYLDPGKNPYFNKYLETTSNDIASRVNGMFASAGRDMSGANIQSLARGITEGTAPIFANQYNQNVATQRNASDNLYNAGNQTAGVLSGLDQTALGNRQTGVTAANAALEAKNYSPTAVLNAAGMSRNLPLQNIGAVSGLLTPLASLGGTGESKGYATQDMQFRQPLSQTAGQWLQSAAAIPNAISGIGSGINTLGNWFSPFGR